MSTFVRKVFCAMSPCLFGAVTLVFVTVSASASQYQLPSNYNFLQSNYDHGTNAMIVADFNGDGIPDIFDSTWVTVPDLQSPTTVGVVLLGKGDGTFQPPITVPGIQPRCVPASAMDFNHDGKPDLLIVCPDTGNVSLYPGNGDGTFGTPINSGAIQYLLQPIAVIDVNGDGIPDLLSITSNDIFVASGHADGSFGSPASVLSPGLNTIHAAAVADVNGDGKPDLVGIISGVVAVMLGNGNGTFQQAVNYLANRPTAVAIADVNGDGKQDIVTSWMGSSENGTSQVAVLLGNGDGTFNPAEVSPAPPNGMATSIAFGDFNGDGKLDIAVGSLPTDVGDTRSGLYIFDGNGDGTFQFTESVPGINPPAPWQVIVADFNRDGAPDLLTSNDVRYYNVTGFSVLLNCKKSCVNLSFGSANSAQFVYGTTTPLTLSVQSVSGTGTPTGTVKLQNDVLYSTNVIASGTLQGGSTNLTLPLLGPSNYEWSAVYSGDSQFAPAISSELSVAIIRANTSTTISASQNPATTGQSITLTFHVAPQFSGTPTGRVNVTLDGNAFVAPNLDASGTATYSTSSLAQGTHVFTASYPGDNNFNGSCSTSLTLNVVPPGPPDFSIGAGGGGTMSQTVTAGQTASYAMSLAPQGGFTGTVTLTCSGAPSGASCAVTPSSVNVTGTTATPFTVSVTTAARSGTVMSGSVAPRPNGPRGWMLALLFGGMFSVWFASHRRALAKIPTHAKGGRGWGTLPPTHAKGGRGWGTHGILLVLVFVVLVGMIGCGGGGSSSTKLPVQTGTPAGTYTIVVNATSGSTTHTQNLTLVVN